MYQPLAWGTFDSPRRAFAVAQLARVPAHVKFGEIAMQVPVRDVVEGADDSALERAVIALGEVGMEDDPPDERLGVIHREVVMKVLVQAGVALARIRHNGRRVIHESRTCATIVNPPKIER